MNAPIPLELQIWDAEACGAYFGESREHFLRTTRHAAGFPRELARVAKRWSAVAVCTWALGR